MVFNYRAVYPFLLNYPLSLAAIREAYQTALAAYQESDEDPLHGQGTRDFVQNNNRFRIAVTLVKTQKSEACSITVEFLVNP